MKPLTAIKLVVYGSFVCAGLAIAYDDFSGVMGWTFSGLGWSAAARRYQ